MVFVKMLGFFDVIAAVMIILGQFHVIGWRILGICAAYLIIKGIIFLKDFASKIDILVGIYCLMLIVKPIAIITVLASIYLAIKGFFSFA
jgi:hypothetical protein